MSRSGSSALHGVNPNYKKKIILWNFTYLENISECSEFSILVSGVKSKNRKPWKFPTSSNKTHSMKFTSLENISL